MLEKIAVKIFSDETNELSLKVAEIIADLISSNNQRKKKTVLGLATGNTPLDVYRELIHRRKEEGLDFSRVITFNLDEYYGLDLDHINSYHQFMQENLFSQVNIKQENIHIPDGTIKEEGVEDYCRRYEETIKQAGGIDLQLLGIGRDGHIGFNEPHSRADSRTRLVTLNEITRRDALPDFGEWRYVPRRAISMGIATILEAEQIILMATGEHKAPIIRQTVEGPVSKEIVASYLQKHPQVTIFLDEAAASQLTKVRTPWAVEEIGWSEPLIKQRAVCYLSQISKKPIDRLANSDFLENSLGSLAEAYQVEELREHILHKLESKIKDSGELPRDKKILVFSPHPDDDIISLGGALRKLVENNNQIYVAYMTPGYTAVFDHDAENFIIARQRFAQDFAIKDPHGKLYDKILAFFAEKQASPYGLADVPEVLKIKKIIREVEAISTCQFVGVAGYEFLNLPFYQTGRAKKLPVTEKDISIVRQCLDRYQPDLVFAAGDLTDPNGTHRLCLKAIREALNLTKNKPVLWLYRGAWQNYEPWEADVFVPLSQREVKLKREGIFRHESQKDRPPQPGFGQGEFWQRAERKDKRLAQLLHGYGLKEYPAVEAFVIEQG